MEVIKSNKGGKKLIRDGFIYTQRRATEVKIYWRCAKTERFGCSGSIITTSDVSTSEYFCVLLQRSWR